MNTIKLRADEEKRFWNTVKKTDSCWIWNGAIMTSGYGQFHYGQRVDRPANQAAAHRVAYTIVKGDIPQGLEIDHLCGNKLCVNPYHLKATTHAENVGRALSLNGKCKQGHDKNGKRTCRKCALQRYAEAHNGALPRPRGYCKQGHVLSDDNSIVTTVGEYVTRRCKTCRRAYTRERARERLGITPDRHRK